MKLVLIEWVDSQSLHGTWKRLAEIHDAGTPLRCRSVGWLVRSTGGCKVIVPHISGAQQPVVPYGAGDLSIPNQSILKMTTLRRG